MDRSQSSQRVSGLLAGFEVAFRAELERTGYTPSSVRAAISAMGQLSGWMQQNAITAEMLSPAVLDVLPRRLRGTRLVVRFLRDGGAIPEARCVDGAGPVGLVVAEFREWLARERGLAAETVRCYGNHAHTFLAWLGEPLEQLLAVLQAGTVTSFMVEHCEQVSCANAKASVTALRALLRFLHLTGHVPTGLVELARAECNGCTRASGTSPPNDEHDGRGERIRKFDEKAFAWHALTASPTVGHPSVRT